MHKLIRVDVSIENNKMASTSLTGNVYDILFSEHSSETIDPKNIIDNVSRVMKKFDNWSTITITVTCKDKGDYTHAKGREILHTVRYVNDHKLCRMEWTNQHEFLIDREYTRMADVKKAIYNSVKWACEVANESFIHSMRSYISEFEKKEVN